MRPQQDAYSGLAWERHRTKRSLLAKVEMQHHANPCQDSSSSLAAYLVRQHLRELKLTMAPVVMTEAGGQTINLRP